MLLFMTSILGQSACWGFVRPKKRLIIVLGLITAVVVKMLNVSLATTSPANKSISGSPPDCASITYACIAYSTCLFTEMSIIIGLVLGLRGLFLLRVVYPCIIAWVTDNHCPVQEFRAGTCCIPPLIRHPNNCLVKKGPYKMACLPRIGRYIIYHLWYG